MFCFINFLSYLILSVKRIDEPAVDETAEFENWNQNQTETFWDCRIFTLVDSNGVQFLKYFVKIS